MDSSSDTLEKYEEDYELLGALEAMREVENSSGLESDDFIQALISVGKILNERGEYLEALGYFIRGRAVLETREEQLHPLMSEILAGIGEHYLIQGMLVESLPYYQKSLSVKEALCIAETSDCAHLHMKAGEILCMQGELTDAKEHMLRSYQILTLLGGTDSFGLGEVCHNLGVILLSEEYYERAADYLNEASAHRSKYFGEHSLESADSLWALGKCYLGTNNHTHALEQLYEVITIREEILGEEDVLVKESKKYYRSISADPSAVAQETMIIQANNIAQLQSGDAELLSALLSATALAVDKNEATIAKELLRIAIGCLNGNLAGSSEITERVIRILSEQALD